MPSRMEPASDEAKGRDKDEVGAHEQALWWDEEVNQGDALSLVQDGWKKKDTRDDSRDRSPDGRRERRGEDSRHGCEARRGDRSNPWRGDGHGRGSRDRPVKASLQAPPLCGGGHSGRIVALRSREANGPAAGSPLEEVKERVGSAGDPLPLGLLVAADAQRVAEGSTRQWMWMLRNRVGFMIVLLARTRSRSFRTRMRVEEVGPDS